MSKMIHKVPSLFISSRQHIPRVQLCDRKDDLRPFAPTGGVFPATEDDDTILVNPMNTWPYSWLSSTITGHTIKLHDGSGAHGRELAHENKKKHKFWRAIWPTGSCIRKQRHCWRQQTVLNEWLLNIQTASQKFGPFISKTKRKLKQQKQKGKANAVPYTCLVSNAVIKTDHFAYR